MQVLVYNGSGVSAASRDYTLGSLRAFLSHRYDVQLVSPKSLRTEPWEASCAALVVPGGRDLPYQAELEGTGNARIKAWVEKGGRYLGFCAGAYYASTRVEFEVGSNLEVTGDRDLRFYPGTCAGGAFPGFEYETEAGAREVELELNRTVWRDYWSQSPNRVETWYNGGGMFVNPSHPNVQILATYSQLEGKPAAGVLCDVGKGRAVLWGVHPEHPMLRDSSRTATPPSHSNLPFEEKEGKRTELVRATLALLGLEVSDRPAPPPKLAPLFLASDDLSLVAKTAAGIASKATTPNGPEIQVNDRHDTFALWPSTSANMLLDEARVRPGATAVEELHESIKHICVCDKSLPGSDATPLFDLSAYFDNLSKSASLARLGRILLYGEAVTSTQTMLDKNDRFLSAIPTGLICIASHQIAGRGRGANSWVSPAGCLQFSLVLRLPTRQNAKIVFVQYLFGLAVVEAVRTTSGYEEIGIRLKWPNDIYGDVGSGEGLSRYKKIGGILVNSSYAGDEFTIVVGCGVNTSNPKPTTSINELVALHNSRTEGTLAPIRQEDLLAAIIAKFDSMWDVFLAEGFAPFTDAYLERWLHSDQRVTVKATKQLVRIVGITPDYGLLRTIPVDVDRAGNEVYGGGFSTARPFVDLQPDGNSFDMIHNLLVAK